jgi:hypothetical protein
MTTQIIDSNTARADCLATIFRLSNDEKVDLLFYHINDAFPDSVEATYVLVYSGGGVLHRSIQRNPQLAKRKNIYWLDRGLLSDCQHVSQRVFTAENCRLLRDFVQGRCSKPAFINGPFQD